MHKNRPGRKVLAEVRKMSKENQQTPFEKKASALAGETSGIQEKAAFDAAVEEVDRKRGLGDELNDEEFEEHKEDEGEDVIIPEKKPEGEKEGEEDDEDAEEEISLDGLEEGSLEWEKARADKFEKKYRLEKKYRKKSVGNLKGKLSSMERAAAPAAGTEEIPKDIDILKEVGVEDPDEPLTAAQQIKAMELTVQNQAQKASVKDGRKQQADKLQQRAAESEAAAQEKYEDYDEVTDPFKGVFTPGNADYDPEFVAMIFTRKDPAQALYDWAKKQTGEPNKSGSDDDGGDRLDAARKTREKKRETMTMNRTGGGSGKTPKETKTTKGQDVYSRMIDGDDTEVAKLEEEYGGLPK
jgi:hypothetical protein